MNEKLTTKEMIVRIVEKSGMTKKITSDLLRILPELIESALARDGELRIAGLGIFKLKWVKARRARNLKTGESVEVPAHNKVVFYPQKGLKEIVNEEYRHLTYQVIEGKDETVSHQSPVVSPITEKKADKEPVVTPPEPPDGKATESIEPERPDYRSRKMIYWVIPFVFVVIALLIVIFYMRNCQDELKFPRKASDSQEQVIKPSETAPPSQVPMQEDTSVTEPVESPEEVAPEPPAKGFPQQLYTVTPGKYLFQIARETYGDPFLWSLIYKENQAKISDPEQVINGIELVIPSLEGTPSSLSKSDSTRISDAYHMLYEYYTSKGDERAKDFQYAVKVFSNR
jgi:nucleoid DNA-binding protein